MYIHYVMNHTHKLWVIEREFFTEKPELWKTTIIVHHCSSCRYCKFKSSLSVAKCQNIFKAPGADAAYCEDISVTAGTKRPPLEIVTVHSGT